MSASLDSKLAKMSPRGTEKNRWLHALLLKSRNNGSHESSMGENGSDRSHDMRVEVLVPHHEMKREVRKNQSLVQVPNPRDADKCIGGGPIMATMQHSFQAQRFDELSANEGEIILVFARSDDNEWILGKAVSRVHPPGLIPSSFVRLHHLNTTLLESQSSMLSDLPRISEWKSSLPVLEHIENPLIKRHQPTDEVAKVILSHVGHIPPTHFTFAAKKVAEYSFDQGSRSSFESVADENIRNEVPQPIPRPPPSIARTSCFPSLTKSMIQVDAAPRSSPSISRERGTRDDSMSTMTPQKTRRPSSSDIIKVRLLCDTVHIIKIPTSTEFHQLCQKIVDIYGRDLSGIFYTASMDESQRVANSVDLSLLFQAHTGRTLELHLQF